MTDLREGWRSPRLTASLGSKVKRLAVHTLIVLLLFGAALWSVGFIGPTSVAFQSSDGEWEDSEVLFKGRKFEDVSPLFAEYRFRCNPAVTLQRTTPRPPWYTLEHWFNDYSEPKWLVPYAEKLPTPATVHYPETPLDHCCADGGGTAE
jgi:hypothetical protein